MIKPRINIEIDEQIKKDVQVKALMQGKTLTDVVVNLLKKWLKK